MQRDGNNAALSKEADFQAALAKMPTGYATLIFARAQTFVSRIYALAAASGQVINPGQRAEAEKLKVLAATTRIESGKIRDTLYLLAPGHRALPSTLAMSALPLSTVDTLFYATGVFQVPAGIDLPPDAASGSPGAGGLAALRGLGAMLEAHGVKMADVRAAFGNEAALQLDWPSGSAQPKLIASLDVRDHAKADKFVDNLANTLNSAAAWQISQADGLVFHTMSSPGLSVVSPTITLTDRHFVFGLTLADVEDAARREKNEFGELYRKRCVQGG